MIFTVDLEYEEGTERASFTYEYLPAASIADALLQARRLTEQRHGVEAADLVSVSISRDA